MLKFIGKALAGMVLTKEARQVAVPLATRAVRNASLKKNGGPDKSDDPQPNATQQAIADAQAVAASIATPSRAELIRRAMEVRAAKQTLLADLNDEDRAKLVATAMRAFLNEGKPKA